jgi:hypothetical protein
MPLYRTDRRVSLLYGDRIACRCACHIVIDVYVYVIPYVSSAQIQVPQGVCLRSQRATTQLK